MNELKFNFMVERIAIARSINSKYLTCIFILNFCISTIFKYYFKALW